MTSRTLLWSGIVIVLLTMPLSAQVDSALGFFPLHAGDTHQFSYQHFYAPGCSGGYSSYELETIHGDTLLPTGLRYSLVISDISGGLPVRYLRVDSSTANVYSYVPAPTPHETLMDSLRATPGSSFIGNWGYRIECVGMDTMTFLGVRTTVKRFHSNYIYGDEYFLAYGFGLIKLVTHDDDPCYPLLDSFVHDLVFARINGQDFGTFVGVPNTLGETAGRFELDQNYPNPFNPSTTILYLIPAGMYGRTSLRVYDVLGREVAILVDAVEGEGQKSVQFNTSTLAGGVYFYRLQMSGFVKTRKLMILR